MTPRIEISIEKKLVGKRLTMRLTTTSHILNLGVIQIK